MGNPFERGPEQIDEKIECKNCSGTGTVKDSNGNSKTCSVCNGTGHK